MYKVLIRDDMALCAKEILTATGQIEVVIDNNKENGKPENLAKLISEYDGLAIRSGTKVTAAVLENAPRLKVIGRAGIGVDNIDTKAATQKGVVVMNAPGGNTRTTAEHAIAMMLALARNIPQGTSSLRSGRWEKKNLRGIEITAKTLGIFGLGHIGKIVAQLAQGLKMKVVACDPFITTEAARELGVEIMAADEMLACADFISMHVPRLPETTNMINSATIAKMKPGVRLINCARGEVVNLDDLYAALESGQVAGAALDVLPKEPPDPDLPILNHPNVILTPHLGASTGEAQNKVAEMIGNQMSAYLTEGVIVNAVNFPSVAPEVLKTLAPHLELAENLGAILGQLVRNLHDINITYSGEIAGLTTRPLTHAVLKGLLGSFTDQPVNHVNAPLLAEQKGIKVKETVTQDQGHYNGLIKVKLEGCKAETDEIWGAVFEHSYQRIVRLGKTYMDVIPEGAMIVIQNIDKPGVIGNVGTVLGRHDINIGRFQLGRREDRALCMVNVDTPADETVIAELKDLPNILVVQQVILNG
jgi:D-3-phosphoglycerate dehydrogenase / 2-oxoglutarate reductase